MTDHEVTAQTRHAYDAYAPRYDDEMSFTSEPCSTTVGPGPARKLGLTCSRSPTAPGATSGI